MAIHNEYIAFALARIVLGILMFIQAYDKIFKIRLQNVVQAFEQSQNKPINNSLVWVGTIVTSFAELFCGMCLIAGLFTPIALYILSVDLTLVVLAFSIKNAIWDMKFVFPRLALLLFLLSVPLVWNYYSLDQLLFHH